MSDLKPCPFCGEPARIMLAPDVWVQCTGCGAMSAFSATPESAIGKWNRRTERCSERWTPPAGPRSSRGFTDGR